MILIISIDEDISTQKVCKWLKYYNQSYVLITETNRISNLKTKDFFNSDVEIIVNNRKINLKEIKSVWYRRGRFSYMDYEFYTDNTILLESLSQEWNVINDYLINFLNQDQYFNRKPNKLIVLNEAKLIGLKVPLSILTYDKNDLLNFKGKRIISKPVNEVISLYDSNNIYSSFTIEVHLDELEENFPLSFFQELVEKKYEIRVFYFKGLFFSSVIFSQANEQTEIDYRDYNYSKPIKQIPYNLPNEIKKKIKILMDKLSLSSGSIDLIYGLDGEFYFLEVNPIGQFDSLSVKCNYNIEKEIAKVLIIENEKGKTPNPV